MSKMNNLKVSYSECKNSLYLLCVLCVGLFAFDLFAFNQAFFIDKVIDLQEKRYSITDGTLYEFNMDSGELVSQGYDPNVTFDNINLPVASISVNCDNSAMDAVGQVFYRSSDESFSESRSVVYNTSLHDPIILVLNPSFFEKKIISSLRLDLTNVSGDKIVCGEFVVNPQVVYNLDVTRLVVYVGFFLAIVLYLFRNIYMGFFLHTKYEEKITYFIVIEILQVVLFKSLNVPLNDQYVVLKLNNTHRR